MRDFQIPLVLPYTPAQVREIARRASATLEKRLPELRDEMPYDTGRLAKSWRIEPFEEPGGRVGLRFEYEWYGVFHPDAERAFEEWVQEHVFEAVEQAQAGENGIGNQAFGAAVEKMFREWAEKAPFVTYTPGRNRR